MIVSSYPRYVTPQNIRKAMHYGQLAYNVGKKMYSAYQSIKPKTTTTLAKSTARPVNAYKYKLVAKPKSTYRKTRYIRKVRSLARKVGPVFKKSIYNKKTSKIRRNNTGKLSLQNRIQNGLSLPNVTFARLQWRGSTTTSTVCRNFAYTGTSSANISARTYCLNDISSSPTLFENLNHSVNYHDLWKSLYDNYKVLGATAMFKITPTSLPSQQVTTQSPSSSQLYSFQLPLSVKNGFWYARVYYHRATISGSTDEDNSVGHPIDEG